ncbi:AAA family ATPase [Opitutus terrae]|uniref:AAA+ ATPase domain-containing protein n=1 Tax=Opitutus terrae (strain DSM 11246 / JCM 15787 / PB90-1) TaxID=452637 RepID=B1ZQG7_OPITP|nr:AAA family ATPase [Opitutus terrae]ACB75576.1 hypothetical protein Oter_2294 [Opitutus terrae PB90-1]
MAGNVFRSEIRDSEIRELLEKVRKQSYGKYLVAVTLEKIRQFQGGKVRFDFPVTALIGPNGSGKSTILAASACAYASAKPKSFFRKSRVGDEGMEGWRISYEVIDKGVNHKGLTLSVLTYQKPNWSREGVLDRSVKYVGIDRTVPAAENPGFTHKRKLSEDGTDEHTTVEEKKVEGKEIENIRRHAERVIGRPLDKFELVRVTFTVTRSSAPKSKLLKVEVQPDGTIVSVRQPLPDAPVRKKVISSQQTIFVGYNGTHYYSEFNFGAGESSILRTVATMEALPENSLVLVEEVENGLHPLAATRMVEYFVDFARRTGGQVVFTTHSDYALRPLPSEAIWSCVDGKLQQGKLSIESLRAISGRVDRRLAVFVEDDFAREWLLAIARELLGDHADEIGIYPVFGDGNAVQVHLGHRNNPAVNFGSICVLDGDSKQNDDASKGIFRLPGASPEAYIFDRVRERVTADAALLTASLQRSLKSQADVVRVLGEVSHTNRDPHLLFNQVGEKLGLVSEIVVRGAFFSVWLHNAGDVAAQIAGVLKAALDEPVARK